MVSIGAVTRCQLCRDGSRTSVAGNVRTLFCAATGLEPVSPSSSQTGVSAQCLGYFGELGDSILGLLDWWDVYTRGLVACMNKDVMTTWFWSFFGVVA